MINWKEIPFVKFLLPFVTGILLSIFLGNNHPIWYGILLSSILVRIIFSFKKIPNHYRHLHGILAHVLLFSIGYLWCFHFNELNNKHHFQQDLKIQNIIIGKVETAPTFGKYLKATLSTQLIGTHLDSLKKCTGNILIYLKNDSTRQLKYGDIIAFHGRIQKVEPPKNPHAFNYKNFLKFKNIHFQVFINKPENWQKSSLNQGSLIHKNAIQIRQYFLTILQKHLPTSQELSVGNALILGYKNDLDEEVRTAYAHTGALHVLAVSGLHVGLVAWFVNMLLSLVKSRTRTWRITRAIILIGVVWSFALISGGSPSVLRAATMFTFLIIGLAMNRTTNIYNSLAISASILLVWNPYLLMSVSFQLSYLAITSIVYFQPKIYRTLIVKNGFLRSIWNLISLSLAAQIGTLPISIYYFHSVPLFAWLSGVIVIPAATIILGSGMLLLVVESLIPSLAFIPGWILYYSIWLMNQAIFLIQKFPSSVWIGVWIGFGIVLLMYTMIGNIILALSTKKLKWLLPASVFLFFISINYSFTSFGEIGQKKMIIYHSNRNSIIDFFEGKNGFSFHQKDITEKNLSFATQNNRWANGVKKVNPIYFENMKFQSKNIFYQKPFIQFFDKKIVLLSDTFQFRKDAKIKVDFIIIQNNPKFNLEEILANFIFKKIIFDTSNSQWKVETWKTNCQKLNIAYYDIFEKGAFEIALE
ncbi:MAG: ComEC/Rec2 family competence protein [Saprospiraceae bacterium]